MIHGVMRVRMAVMFVRMHSHKGWSALKQSRVKPVLGALEQIQNGSRLGDALDRKIRAVYGNLLGEV